MTDVVVCDHPAAARLLAVLRDESTPPSRFREAAGRIGAILALEALRDLPTIQTSVRTPLDDAPATLPDRSVVAVPVLRAGLGLLPGLLDLLPDTVVGMIGLERDPDTLEPDEYYRKLPDLTGRWVLLLEPMLATGGSAGTAVALLRELRPERLAVLSVVATEVGIKRVATADADVRIVTAAIDPDLNEHGYIVPGLGDFGDRVFGTPH